MTSKFRIRHNIIFLSIGILPILFSCNNHSSKIKELEAQLDSLRGDYGTQKNTLDEVFASLNEIENGLKNIREAENILSVETLKDGIELPNDKREKIKNNIIAIQNAINQYKQKIEELKRENNIKSVEFRKRLNSIQKELNEKSNIIEKLSEELEAKNIIIKERDEKIEALDSTISFLEENINSLQEQTEKMQNTIKNQQKEINTAYYIVGDKDDLVKVGVLTKGGLFSSSKVSYKADKSAFIKIDYTQISTISTNSNKAKILSNHPKDTYSIENIDGEAIITISKPEEFWEQTKYLIIQTN